MIFSTPHGSRLYGLHHDQSDYDTFEVYADDRPMRQRVSGASDVTTVGLATFLHYAHSGSHQAVEALYSRQKTYHNPAYAPLIENTVVMPGNGVHEKFLRTIKKFSFGDYKRRRHAIRLSFLLLGIRKAERPDPTLDPLTVSFVNSLATHRKDNSLFEVLSK